MTQNAVRIVIGVAAVGLVAVEAMAAPYVLIASAVIVGAAAFAATRNAAKIPTRARRGSLVLWSAGLLCIALWLGIFIVLLLADMGGDAGIVAGLRVKPSGEEAGAWSILLHGLIGALGLLGIIAAVSWLGAAGPRRRRGGKRTRDSRTDGSSPSRTD